MRRSELKLFLVLIFLSVVTCVPASAQSKRMTPREKANLKFVFDWWREVVIARHVDLAPQYMAEDYIQHDPNVGQGRAAIMAYIGRRPPLPIPATLESPPKIFFAKGDYVALIFEREEPDPADLSKMYKYYSFTIVRIQNGRIQEHWGSAQKTAPTPANP